MCKMRFKISIENMCNVFQQLIMPFCIVRQNTHCSCQCQLISSRTSESCYAHFFLLLILCKDTKVHLAKAAKQFKITQSCRSISMAWFCCLVGLCWFVNLFSQSSHLCCVPMKLLSGMILCEPFVMCFSCFVLFELSLLCSSVYWTTFLHVA